MDRQGRCARCRALGIASIRRGCLVGARATCPIGLGMIRIVLFLLLIAAAAWGAAWIADQPGDAVLQLAGWRIETTVPILVLALGILVVAAILLWSVITMLL